MMTHLKRLFPLMMTHLKRLFPLMMTHLKRLFPLMMTHLKRLFPLMMTHLKRLFPLMMIIHLNQVLIITAVKSSDDNQEFPLDNSLDYDIEDGNDYFGIPLQRPASRPMINFPGDVELEDDYEIGWEWLERDTGPMIAPYSGFRQCLLDPTQNKPEDFFNALFESNMYTRIAEETNRYANARINNAEGKEQIFFLYSEIHKMI